MFEKEQILKLLDLSDEELMPRINAVLEVLGVPAEARETLFSDTEALREKARNINEFDLYKVRLLLGDEKLRDVLSVLGQ